MKIFFVFTFLLSMSTSWAQQYSEATSLRYELDQDELAARLRDRIPSSIFDKYPVEMSLYSDQFSRWTCREAHFLSQEASAYQPLESYLNLILQQVMPEELSADSQIMVKVDPVGFSNASMTPAGIMIVNLGLLSAAEDEASIAAVMCHELAHYYRNHGILRVANKLEGEYKNTLLGFIMDDSQFKEDFSLKQEAEADSLGLRWLTESEYSAMGHLQSTLDIKREEDQLKLTIRGGRKQSSHPVADERIAMINRMITDLKQDTAYRFIVSHEAFKKFQYEARIASFEYFLSRGYHSVCLREAFKYHILDTSNVDYIYFVLEAIRRNHHYRRFPSWLPFYLDDFVLDTLYLNPTDNQRQAANRKSLFDRFIPTIMAMSPKEIQHIQARHFWQGQPSFKTNGEAFDYFYQRGTANGCTECELSFALYYRDSVDVNPYLHAYQTRFDAKYPEFASALKDESYLDSLQHGTWVIFNDLNLYMSYNRNFLSITTKDFKMKSISDSLMSIVAGRFPDRSFFHVDDLFAWNPAAFRLLMELPSHPHFSHHPEEVGSIFLIDPRYWYLMKNIGVDEVQFISWGSSEWLADIRKVDRYEALKSRSVNSMLELSKRERFFSGSMITTEMTGMKRSYTVNRRNDPLEWKETTASGVLGYTIGMLKTLENGKLQESGTKE